ncbi:epoxide hydrolase family protein [Asanoa siamensis]|uniref:Hydrolase n=1 Tax=Asanoa siamensis TaxID=926357 RepID=A0ABQ4CP75_9ACTN|nr:epoxide hydrolase family protein [Asanoa siamensis]GIF72652.1 hydrolase [Asanoa siamensis]
MVTPYRVDTPRADLDDLRRRLRATRWPEPAPVDGWAQGVPLDYLRDLVSYWADGYDWRATQHRVNQIPQVTVTVDGLGIHALHARGGGLPVLLTHGWPGSFFEYEAAVAPLVAAGFDVVVPSLPGYGFSGKPTEPGWDIHRIARAWAALMSALGYDRFIAQGSDWGTSVSTSLALQVPERLIGLHLVPPLVAPTDDDPTPAEAAALADLAVRAADSGYSVVHATRPQTLGYSLVDSPAGLCAWIVDKIWSWADHDGDLSTVLTRDQVLDDVTLYWLTRSGASSTRLYRESIAEVSRWFTAQTTDRVRVPTGCTVFPREVPRPSRRWAERRFANIVHWGEPARGGHFGAWEQPEAFVAELTTFAARL